MISLKNFKPLLLIVAIFALIAISRAAGTPLPYSSFCGGGISSTLTASGGIIPTNSILAGQTTGEQNVMALSIIIMLTMLLIIALIYLVSYVTGLELLRNLTKAEFGELILTAIVVFIFLGGFVITSSAISSSNFFAAGGSSFGRQTYVDDCSYLTSASVSLIAPLILLQTTRLVIDTAESTQISLTPAAFGIVFLPFKGYDLFDAPIEILTDISWAFILFIFGTLIILGFLFGLFPLFLYAGIVLRTIPWTRAAGGAFLGLFVGFYIVFPILLHVMLSGYFTAVSSPTTATTNSNSIVVSSIVTSLIGAAAGGAVPAMTAVAQVLTGTTPFSGFGIVNGYLYYVIEPAAFTIFALVVAFIISFDFAELVGDLLGAPSLSGNITQKLLK